MSTPRMASDGLTEIRADQIGLIHFLRDVLDLIQITFQGPIA
ncbi:MAG TPA: hypothetical protein VKB88_44040 [Bryobacteraceae bacterium]|nr:hypothetical protein [Bryobacteraceae bacterium]